MSDRMLPEYLLESHFEDKMLFLSGPRQVGKTTIANNTLKAHTAGGIYLNYDIPAHRKIIKTGTSLLDNLRKPNQKPMIVFDEIHKMAKFKAYLKGFYDENKDETQIWVAGSGRLDLYQKGGDSLLGRYFPYHLHPFTIGELGKHKLSTPETFWNNFENRSIFPSHFENLLVLGGFPEPFLKQNKSFHKRWLQTRRERITREDIRDLTRILDLDKVETLIELLNSRIGSPLSVNSLREDLQVAFETVTSWIETLDRVFYIYSILPYSSKIQRAIKKERKVYYWDWSEVENEAARFENFVLSHLKKACDTWTDFGIESTELRYIRDKEKREVDAVLLLNRKPFLLIEVKLNEETPSKDLIRFGKTLDCQRLVQVINKKGVDKRIKMDGQILHLTSAENLLQYLP